MLDALGLSSGEVSVYTDLVTSGAADADLIATRKGLPTEQVAVLLAGLLERGLATATGEPGVWMATPPEVALQALINERRHDLAAAEIAAARLIEAHRPKPGTVPEDHLEVVTGAGAVALWFHQLQLGATREVLALVTHQPVAVTGADNDAEDVAASRGVRYRVVVEREALAGDGGLEQAAASLGRDEEIRVIERVPTKLVIADRRLALVPVSPDAPEPMAVVVRSPGLVARWWPCSNSSGATRGRSISRMEPPRSTRHRTASTRSTGHCWRCC